MIVSLLTDSSVGGTFVSWSIHYLAGHEDYYHAIQNKKLVLTDNPIDKLNAHNFEPNQTTTKEDFEKVLHNLINQKTDTFHSIYFHQFWNKKPKSYDSDTANAIHQLKPHAKKTVLIPLTYQEALYNFSYIPREKSTNSWFNPDVYIKSAPERWKEFFDYFFSDESKTWKFQNLTNVWDQRECLALNLRPFEFCSILENINVDHDAYTLHPMELWNRFEFGVIDLFDYLEVVLDKNRYKKWVHIYNNWKTLHQQRVMFVWYFDRIIEYILSGRSLDLSKFKLDIVQEAAIQHALIYKHNLNLKSWQLDKFINTKQLHNLLEPNIHPI